MSKTQEFLTMFKAAEEKYDKVQKRLAAEAWEHDWQILIATIMSAQSRDETTIPIAENLFLKYLTLQTLANAKFPDVLKVFKSLNYKKSKAKHVIEAAKYLVKHHQESIPNTIEQLIEIPGVGRKTANLVLAEVHKQSSITVDTHVHRISNVLGLVKTKTPEQTEYALQKIAPQETWSRINRLFVLWGKDVPGRNKQRFLDKLKERSSIS